ncbi:MAG: helix-turn-helix transcriptional regulator [Chloroflexi bacterium]|nr:helix-turn-helix transcriptional regulator [Chloroflexota bacterium]
MATRHEDPDYQFELLVIEIGEAIVARMKELGLNRSQLAERMGVSRARVTQVLRGSDNLTLKTLVAVAHALDASFTTRLSPRSVMGSGNVTAWRDCRTAKLPRGVVDQSARAA